MILASRLLVLLLQLRARELGEPAERHVQDVVGLDLRELERRHQLRSRLLRVLRAADDLDDLVEMIERDQEALDDVVPLLGLPEVVLGPSRDDVDLVIDVVADHLGEVQRARNAVDERQHDHTEGLLELGVLVELVQDDLGIGAALEVDHETHAGPARGVVLEVGDVLDLAGLHEVGDLLREARLVHLVRQLGDDDARSAGRPFLDGGDGADLDRASACLVRVADAVAAHDDGAGREVRSLDEFHEVLRRGLGMFQVVDDGVDHLAEVVRRDVRRHPDGDPAGAVHQQVGEARRQDDRLLLVPVVVGHEVDGLRIDVAQELHRDGRQTGLRVPGRGGGIAVDRSEVAVWIHQRMPEGEVLRHPDQGVVDRGVAVRVVLGHHAADDVRGFPMGPIRPQSLFEHRPEDPAVDRLQPVADLRAAPG